MRVLVITALFFSSLYLFWPRPVEVVEVDDVQVKSAAPNRTNRILTVKTPEKRIEINDDAEIDTAEAEDYDDGDGENDRGVAGEISLVAPDEEANEHYEEVPLNELEKGWQDELHASLTAIEPQIGNEMFDAYVKEREGFQSELDSMIQKNQKSQNLEGMIEELEYKHEEKIKEIFGTHYEQVKNHQDKYLESVPTINAIQTP